MSEKGEGGKKRRKEGKEEKDRVREGKKGRKDNERKGKEDETKQKEKSSPGSGKQLAQSVKLPGDMEGVGDGDVPSRSEPFHMNL